MDIRDGIPVIHHPVVMEIASCTPVHLIRSGRNSIDFVRFVMSFRRMSQYPAPRDISHHTKSRWQYVHSESRH